MNSARCTISKFHCENCGSTDPEDVANLVDTEGYTRCCNELPTGQRDCRAHHEDF